MGRHHSEKGHLDVIRMDVNGLLRWDEQGTTHQEPHQSTLPQKAHQNACSSPSTPFLSSLALCLVRQNVSLFFDIPRLIPIEMLVPTRSGRPR